MTDSVAAAAAVDAHAVARFWLENVGPKRWFRSSEAVDAACAAALGPWIAPAARGALDGWLDAPVGAFALLILFDQAPRNLFRGTARQFAYDPLARAVARRALASGHDRAWPDAASRIFFYLPLEHSERLDDQDRAIALIAERAPEDAEALRHARLHRETILRFGRFPHRNATLGRASTPEEQAYLDGGGYAPGAAPSA